jgi:tetratricopeptide (TPR) repeat protein
MKTRYWPGALLGILFFLLTASSSSGGEKSSLTVDEDLQMGLADRFFQEGDYYRAITEYKRFLFFFPQSPRADEAMQKIAKSYFNGKRWNEAIQAIDELGKVFPSSKFIPEAILLQGLSFAEKKDYAQARFFFRKVQEISPATPLADEAQWQIALTYVKEENWKEAGQEFRKVRPGSKLYGRGEYFAQGLDRIKEIPRKSPETAGILAAILPGAGHLYCERYRDAAIAFLLNGAFLWGIVESFDHQNYAVGGILTFFELGWYGGNIYSAVASAQKYNRKKEQEYLDSLEKGISLSISMQGRTPVLAFRYVF